MKAWPIKTDLSAEDVRHFLDYDAITGVFAWKTGRRTGAYKTCGCVNQWGYMQIQVKGSQYKAHRLAWLHHYGKWPDGVIDHINGNKTDNRIENLRDVTVEVNNQNLHGPKSHRRQPGMLGTYKSKKSERWKAIRWHRGVKYDLGWFSSVELAHEAYRNAIPVGKDQPLKVRGM